MAQKYLKIQVKVHQYRTIAVPVSDELYEKATMIPESDGEDVTDSKGRLWEPGHSEDMEEIGEAIGEVWAIYQDMLRSGELTVEDMVLSRTPYEAEEAVMQSTAETDVLEAEDNGSAPHLPTKAELRSALKLHQKLILSKDPRFKGA